MYPLNQVTECAVGKCVCVTYFFLDDICVSVGMLTYLFG